MKEIDIASWDRKEHFKFFGQADLPFYNVNVNVDITGLRGYAKALPVSFNTLLIYLTIRAANRVENFRYRCRGESVVLHDRLHPSFAHIREGEDLFRLITVDFSDDLAEFDQIVRARIEDSDSYFNLEKAAGRDDFVFISSMPWVSFTGLDHTLSLARDDGVPRATWGKFFDEGGKTLLPYNIRVNHMFVDGIHVGRFFDALGNEIRQLTGKEA